MEDYIKKKDELPDETGADTAEMGTATFGQYTNPYAGQIQELYEGITAREPFQYDVNEDAMYEALRDQYITGGQMAMMDTMGQAAQLTGGYGNSYAQGVGQQAYHGYLQGLNEQLPDLYNMALNNYIQTGDAMLQQYSMLQDMAADDYGKFIDDRNFQYQADQDQKAWDYQDQMDQREMAIQMLEKGQRPSDEMLEAAGLSQEYVDALYPQWTGGSVPPVTKITTAELGDILYGMGSKGASMDEMYEVIDSAYSTGSIDEGNTEMWKQTVREMWGKG